MFARTTYRMAAVLSGAVASMMIAPVPVVAQDQPLVIYGARPGGKLEMVSYRDLNLRYANHQSALYQRVGGAVRRVCSFDAGNIPIVNQDYRTCSGDAWARARPQINRAVAIAFSR